MSAAVGAPTNVDVVAFAVAALGGVDGSVHLEHVSVKAAELSPGAFRWDLDEFAQRIDKDKVRVSLTDAQKAKYGGLVRAVAPKRAGISKPTDVWRLIPDGVEWILENQVRLANALQTNQPGLKKGQAKRVRDRILGSELYVEYNRSGRVEYSPFEFADLVEVSPDAQAGLIQRRYDELAAQVRLLGDTALKQFLSICESVHADMLLEEGEGPP